MEAFLEEFQHLKIQLKEIKSAAANFHEWKIIGRGGFGKVYKGVISHSKGRSEVAFKRLDRKNGQGDPEFWKEILMLSHYKHENLISLLGFCDEEGERILVYEYASNGSLDRHLSATTLTWRQRLKICVAVAGGLCYLHDPKETQHRVLHRDIKSSNILLDENWIAKISDMGLSKIGPTYPMRSFLATNVVGTPGYIDPLYMETYSLTKESDVYSLGVVLFEVLCGRLCFETKNGFFQSFVQIWKQRYEEKKLNGIIFHDLKQHMDPSSLETFSDIAYRCLHRSREERPKMSHVVEKLEIALLFQEISEGVEPAMGYKEMGKISLPPLVYRSEEELKMLLSKGIFVNGGQTWFWLNEDGEHCEMISAAKCVIPIHTVPSKYILTKSRFPINCYSPFFLEFKIHVKTQFLSPDTTYAVHLVFHFDYKANDYLGLDYILAGETKYSTLYFGKERGDGWMSAELYQFTSDKRNVNLEITFQCRTPLALDGIEFQPMKRVEHQVFEDKKVDPESMSHPDTYWEKQLPTDYKDIIKDINYIAQWTTKKELYSMFCKGFPIRNGKERFSLAKNGKKCHMISARMTLREEEWKWQSLGESRFEKVAFKPRYGFWINCKSDMLSPQTTYATYLVYKLQDNHYGVLPPLKVSTAPSYPSSYTDDHSYWYIFLLSPQTPIIRPKVSQNTQNPLTRPKMKGLPQQRSDGWMEVQVWEFQTTTTGKSILQDLRFTLSHKNSFEWLFVQGIEFRPI